MDLVLEVEEEIKQLKQDVADCKKCELGKTRKNPVIGSGSIHAQVMFIGEAPGYNEDMQGRPFVGKAGNILSELLESIGLRREEIYIANILKCRPTSLSFMKYNFCISCKNFEECYKNILKY